ncbi:hypothetical protein EBU95_02235 [bacterium]|nr:hypothetical protein [bacterium]
MGVIVLLVFAIGVANVYVQYTQTRLDDVNKRVHIKLQTLQQDVDDFVMSKLRLFKHLRPQNTNFERKKILDELYSDANIINFLYSIRSLSVEKAQSSSNNDEQFYLLLMGTNNILKIHRQIEDYYTANGVCPENTSEMLQTALQLRAKTINNVHNFVYTSSESQKRILGSIINRYTVLISRITDKIYYYYKLNIKQRGINNSTTFVDYNTTKPYIELDNYTVIPKKQPQKVLLHYI